MNPINIDKINEVLRLIDNASLRESTREYLNDADEKTIEMVRQAQLQANDMSKMLGQVKKEVEQIQRELGDKLASACSHCFKTKSQLGLTAAKLQRCSACKITHYCSKKCQQANWATHKSFCIKHRK